MSEDMRMRNEMVNNKRISEDFIVKNEIMNDGNVIHLYYSPMYQEYLTYGYSAYIVAHSPQLKDLEIQQAYSDDLQMPMVHVDHSVKDKLLKTGVVLKDSIEGLYYNIESFEQFNENEYSKWASFLRGE